MRADVVLAGKYRLIKQIGVGGMGAVWLSRNEMTEREFAIKLLRPIALADPKAVARFVQEARVTAKLRHPSLLEIFDVGVASELDGAPYLVMELLDGAPLDRAVRKLGALDVAVTLDVMSAVSHALALAHDRGIVHRDIKPANIFLHRPGTGSVMPKLLDFGISKMMAMPEMEPSLGLTQTGSILGSPLYMSPEQLEGDKTLDARSDVHALGVVMWECLVGRAPFVATNYNLLVVEVLAPARPVLASVLPGVPPEITAIVSRAMSRAREQRYASARDLANAIDEVRKTLAIPHALDARTSAEKLFARIAVPSLAPEPISPSETGLVQSTTGAVSVPAVAPTQHSRGVSSPGISSSSASRSSPGSFMVRSDHDASPLARTEVAAIDTSANQTKLSHAVTGDEARGNQPARAEKKPRVPMIAAGIAGSLAVIAFGAWFARAHVPAAPPIEAIAPASSFDAAAVLPAVTASASASALASASASPPASAAVAPIPAPTSSAHAPHTHSHGAPASPTPIAKPAANRGIVSDGL